MNPITPDEQAQLMRMLHLNVRNTKIFHPLTHDDEQDYAAYYATMSRDNIMGIVDLFPLAFVRMAELLSQRNEPHAIDEAEWKNLVEQSWHEGLACRFGQIPPQEWFESLSADYAKACDGLLDIIRLRFDAQDIKKLANALRHQETSENSHTTQTDKKAFVLLSDKLNAVQTYPLNVRQMKQLIRQAWREAGGEHKKPSLRFEPLHHRFYETLAYAEIGRLKDIPADTIWRGFDATYFAATPEENYERLKQCEMTSDLLVLLASLSLEERVRLHSVVEETKDKFICFPNWQHFTTSPSGEKSIRFKKDDLVIGPYLQDDLMIPAAPLLAHFDWGLPEYRVPTEEHLDRIYTALFHLVKTAQEKAHNNNGKSLIVEVGDFHHERTDLTILAMLLHICNRLGIDRVGIEVTEKGGMNINGGRMGGLKELQHRNKTDMPPEKGGPSYENATRNFDIIEWLARVKLGMKTFANDPKQFLPHKEGVSYENLYTKREDAMNRVLARKQYNPRRKFNDCISFYGSFHLEGISKPLRLADKLVISATQGLYIGNESSPQRYYRDSTILPLDDLERVKRIGGEGERESSDNPMVQVLCEGFVTNASTALALAEETDQRMGERLMPLKDAPEKRRAGRGR